MPGAPGEGMEQAVPAAHHGFDLGSSRLSRAAQTKGASSEAVLHPPMEQGGL